MDLQFQYVRSPRDKSPRQKERKRKRDNAQKKSLRNMTVICIRRAVMRDCGGVRHLKTLSDKNSELLSRVSRPSEIGSYFMKSFVDNTMADVVVDSRRGGGAKWGRRGCEN